MDERKTIIFKRSLVFFLFFGLLSLYSCKRTGSVVEQPYIFEHNLRLPSKGITTQTPTLVLMHGYGSNEDDMTSFAKALPEELLVVCPRAPLTLSTGRYSWYPLEKNGKERIYDITEVLSSSKKLGDYILQLIHKNKVHPDKIMLGGFSQGGIMTLTVALTQPDLITAALCLSGQLLPELSNRIAKDRSLQQVKYFISHGTEDTVLPISNMKETAAMLESKGIQVESHWYPVAHTMSQQNYRDMIAWLNNQI